MFTQKGITEEGRKQREYVCMQLGGDGVAMAEKDKLDCHLILHLFSWRERHHFELLEIFSLFFLTPTWYVDIPICAYAFIDLKKKIEREREMRQKPWSVASYMPWPEIEPAI